MQGSNSAPRGLPNRLMVLEVSLSVLDKTSGFNGAFLFVELLARSTQEVETQYGDHDERHRHSDLKQKVRPGCYVVTEHYRNGERNYHHEGWIAGLTTIVAGEATDSVPTHWMPLPDPPA